MKFNIKNVIRDTPRFNRRLLTNLKGSLHEILTLSLLQANCVPFSRMNFASSLLFILALLLAAAPPGVNAEPQLVVNAFTDMELKSDPFPLPFRQRIIADAAQTLRMSSDVDLVNARLCRIGANYTFTLTQSATITLTAQPLDSAGGTQGSLIKLIDNVSYAKGDSSYPLDPATPRYAQATSPTPRAPRSKHRLVW